MAIRIQRLGLAGACLVALGAVGCSADASAVSEPTDTGSGAAAQITAATTAVHAEPHAPRDIRVALWIHASRPGVTTTYELHVMSSPEGEFIRPGDRVTLDVPSSLVTSNRAMTPRYDYSWENLRDARGSVKAIFTNGTTPIASESLTMGEWKGAHVSSSVAPTRAVVVPEGASGLNFEISLARTSDPSVTSVVGPNDIDAAPIFASDPSERTALFDLAIQTPRERLIEGEVVPGAPVRLAFTNDRANRLADIGGIDKKIGRAKTATGPYEYDISGRIEHALSYSVSYGDERGFLPEVSMPIDFASRVRPDGQVVFASPLDVPADAASVVVKFHVRTYLVASYEGYQTTQRRYEDGARILVRDVEDVAAGGGFALDLTDR